MLKRNIINNIANKEIDRGEFLKYVGMFILGLIGFGAIYNVASSVGLVEDEKSKNTRSGFGSGRYGV